MYYSFENETWYLVVVVLRSHEVQFKFNQKFQSVFYARCTEQLDRSKRDDLYKQNILTDRKRKRKLWIATHIFLQNARAYVLVCLKVVVVRKFGGELGGKIDMMNGLSLNVQSVVGVGLECWFEQQFCEWRWRCASSTVETSQNDAMRITI